MNQPMPTTDHLYVLTFHAFRQAYTHALFARDAATMATLADTYPEYADAVEHAWETAPRTGPTYLRLI